VKEWLRSGVVVQRGLEPMYQFRYRKINVTCDGTVHLEPIHRKSTSLKLFDAVSSGETGRTFRARHKRMDENRWIFARLKDFFHLLEGLSAGRRERLYKVPACISSHVEKAFKPEATLLRCELRQRPRRHGKEGDGNGHIEMNQAWASRTGFRALVRSNRRPRGFPIACRE